ncbi:MAG TPA: ATP-binding protein [bacterium]|nr:ATP-binding protein [bacterium]
MIKRTITPKLLDLSAHFPVVTITGPRQSGKTTLCKLAFPDKEYVSLEYPDIREFAQTDPRGFVAQYRGGAVLDEVQRVPGLLSYIQGVVDEDPAPGRFILTGSANFSLLESVSQSLAGRTALLTLLPFTLKEQRMLLQRDHTLFEAVFTGGFPPIYDRSPHPPDWFQSYIGTYLERDVRRLLNVTDLSAFQTFLGLCAGHSGQLMNLSRLGSDTGISHNTAKSWISVLETSYILHKLQPLHANIKKRLIRTPKLMFTDSGLLCHLLGIRTPDELRTHPLRGAIFETFVVSEILKQRFNHGENRRMNYYRDRQGLEIDAVIEKGRDLLCMEAKSSETITSSHFKGLNTFRRLMAESDRRITPVVIYGGDDDQKRSDVTVLSWKRIHDTVWY